MKVWLDDKRSPPAEWHWAKTPADVIALLEQGDVDELSLDHDLGLSDDGGREITGYDVLLWIEQQVATGDFVPPQIRVHSANPPAHERMLRAIDAIERRASARSDSASSD